MAGIQHLGTMPRTPHWSQTLSRGIEGGVGSYLGGQQLAEASKREDEVLNLKRQDVETKRSQVALAERELDFQEDKLDAEVKRRERDTFISAFQTAVSAGDRDAAKQIAGTIKEKYGIDWTDLSEMPSGTQKERAEEAISKGQTLPGMSMAQTEKAAGVLISPKEPTKITAKDLSTLAAASIASQPRSWMGRMVDRLPGQTQYERAKGEVGAIPKDVLKMYRAQFGAVNNEDPYNVFGPGGSLME